MPLGPSSIGAEPDVQVAKHLAQHVDEHDAVNEHQPDGGSTRRRAYPHRVHRSISPSTTSMLPRSDDCVGSERTGQQRLA